MSTPCTTCGEPLADDALRCPTCGSLASPVVEETRSLDQTRSIDDAPPWSIPIREAAPAGPAGGSAGSGRTVALAMLALGVFVLTVVVGTRLLDSDSGTTSGDADAGEVASLDESGGIDRDAVDAAAKTSTTSTTSIATSTTSETTTTTETTPVDPTTTIAAPATTAVPVTTTPARTAPNGTGSVPALSTSFRGWIAQLKSVPYDAGTEALAEEWERTRAAAPGAVAARSNDWSAFGDGFWVLVEPGPFSSADDVRSFCASAGLTADGACLARELRG